MERRGSRKDIGQALLKKLQSSSSQKKDAATKRNRPSSKHDIGSIWYSQSRIKKIESTQKPKNSRKYRSSYRTFATRLFDKLPKVSLPKVTRKRLIAVGVTLLVVLFANLQTGRQTNGPSPETTEVMGSTTNNTPPLIEESPQFTLLYPNGNTEGYEPVRISPEGAAPAYTYLDSHPGYEVIFRVTQQELFEGFDLPSVAQTSTFPMTELILVNGARIYHGYSERGGIQSLITEKDGLIISIRSSQRFPDEVWASYYLSLQK